MSAVPRDEALQKIVETATAMLAGTIACIAGARRINQLRFDAGISEDPDITPFIAIDSETDALPIDPEIRKLWSPTALDGLRSEIDRAEELARSTALPSCQRVIEKFAQSRP